MASTADRTTGRPVVALRLLGGFALEAGGQPVLLPNAVERLVALLALAERPRSRLWVAARLAPEVDEDRARARLRTNLWRLRLAAPHVIETTSYGLALAADISCDVWDVRRAVELSLAEKDDNEAAAILLRLDGELLPDWYERWVLEERVNLLDRRLHALALLSRRSLDSRRLDTAEALANACIRLDHLWEPGHALIIETHLARGHIALALRHYDRYRQTLEQELGIEPSPLIEALVERIPRVR